jgi:ubiquinone/menaquinone biosynthesis C-methylase UbiE
MSDYLDVIYDEGNKPYTTYPEKLTSHLYNTLKMQPGQSMLEPGVGRGDHLKLFKELGLQVCGLDVSPKAKEFSKNLKIDIIDADSEQWPYPDNNFDIVYSKSFIEHLIKPVNYFNESLRVLKPGGLLLTLTPDWESQYKKFYDDYTHVSPFTVISLKDIQVIAGFNDVEVYKFRQLPLAWKYPVINIVCSVFAPFIPVRIKNDILRWSRELMLISWSRK